MLPVNSHSKVYDLFLCTRLLHSVLVDSGVVFMASHLVVDFLDLLAERDATASDGKIPYDTRFELYTDILLGMCVCDLDMFEIAVELFSMRWLCAMSSRFYIASAVRAHTTERFLRECGLCIL